MSNYIFDGKYKEVDPPAGSISKRGQKKGHLPPVFNKWYECTVCGALLAPGEIDKNSCKCY